MMEKLLDGAVAAIMNSDDEVYNDDSDDNEENDCDYDYAATTNVYDHGDDA